MYRKEKPLALKGSASSMCNNLTVHVSPEKNQITYAVVHKSVANIVSTNIDGSAPNHRQLLCKPEQSSGQASGHFNPILIQAKFLQVGTRMILVVTSQKAIQMYEGETTALIYWHALGDPQSPDIVPAFARGICTVEGASGIICVGTHEGHILVFKVPSKGTNITLLEKLKGHKGPICDLVSRDNHLISSDDLGNIRVWHCSGDKFQQRVQISGSGYPCSSIAINKDLIVGGYGDGHIRLFNMQTGKLLAEIGAHARWVTAIDMSNTGLLLSVSEDSFMRVWQVTQGQNLEVDLKFSESVTDLQLVGARFISPDGRAFCVTGYDSNELIFFRN